MGKISLPYVQRVVAKGRIYYRYRRNGQLVQLPADPASPEFIEIYNRTHKSFETAGAEHHPLAGTIAALIAAFKKSGDFGELSPRTKELYIDRLDDIQIRYGRFPIKAMTRTVALALRDTYAAMPGKANNTIKILSRLYSFAIDRGMATTNPILRVKKLKMGSHRPWTPQEIAQFRAKAPAYLQLALDLAVYTGQRQSDIIKMRWNQIKDNGIELRQQKTDAELWIPLHRNLKAALDEAKRMQRIDATVMPTTIIATRNGKPYQRGWFVAEWIENATAAGLPDACVFHGLRKTAAVYLAEAGCTGKEIEAITGQCSRMVDHYTRGANQKTLAKAAIKKFERKK